MLSFEKLQDRIQMFCDDCGFKCLKNIKRGLEREVMRVDSRGLISQKPHPKALGSALTHPHITTDYSEALLELVTPPLESHDDLISFLTELHQFVVQNIDGEDLWPSSMPCQFDSSDDVIIANYGTSNSGQMRHIYRKGLEYRYGKKMQCIAGIHYNFSLPEKFWKCYKKNLEFAGSLQEFISGWYMGAIRNFERYAWLVLYLFGASPAVCKCFFDEERADLDELDEKTYYKPYATSFRMGDFGYKSSVQQDLDISYNSVDEYTKDLVKAIQTKHPDYEKIGVKKNGEYLQLNDSVLQIENEYYGLIRPKRIARRGERSTLALKRRGVEYMEVRCIDVNPLSPIGITPSQALFLDVFLLYCVFEDEPFIDRKQMKEIRGNHQAVVSCGRDPGLSLFDQGREISLKEWGAEIFKRLDVVASLLDRVEGGRRYQAAVKEHRAALDNPALTLSGLLLEKLKTSKQSFTDYALELSVENTQALKKKKLSKETQVRLEQIAKESIQKQKEIESKDKISLDKYIEQYFKGFL